MAKSIQSIERAAAVLRVLAVGPSHLGVVEVANSLQLAKGTVHGILRTLYDIGFVEQDQQTGKYQLGAALLHLGTSYLDANELRARAINWADALASRSGESVRIGTLLDDEVLVVHHVFRPDDSVQTIDIGVLLPPHACALGKALLAYNSGPWVAAHPRREAYTRRTLVTTAELTKAFQEVRELGWASEIEELTIGIAGVAAPIRRHGGQVVGSIGLTGSTDRVCDRSRLIRRDLVSQVQDAARAVSRELGAQRW